MKLKVIMFLLTFLGITAFAGDLTPICVKTVSYVSPFWGSTNYYMQISDGVHTYTYASSSNTGDFAANVKIWMSMALAAKAQGKQLGIYNDPGSFNIYYVTVLDSNCP